MKRGKFFFGHNKLEEKEESKFLKFLGFMWNPLSWVIEAAAVMAIAAANGGGRPPDWQDFVGIITLLVINSTISFIEENNAGNAAAALMARLATRGEILEASVKNIMVSFVLLTYYILIARLLMTLTSLSIMSFLRLWQRKAKAVQDETG